MTDWCHVTVYTKMAALTTRGSTRGRPQIYITRDHLEYLLELQYTWPEMAATFNMSPKTMQRPGSVWGLSKYTFITDQDLQ